MSSAKREIVLKSCTGSGKTIILTHFMDGYFKSFNNTVFVWLTPGKGNLEEQSKEKMDRYIHGSSTKLLFEVMTSGFEANDICFINWEKLTKKGNNALKDGERINFIEYIEKALDSGLTFKIIVDESHQNDTIKADDIIEYFKTDKIIRCSATPKHYKNVFLIDIPEEDFIAEGLIKKVLIINEDFAQSISVEDEVVYHLARKQREGYKRFNLILASFVVKRQFTFAQSMFRRKVHALTCFLKDSMSGNGLARAWRHIMPISISAIFSQLACFGVKCHSKRLTNL